WVETRPGGGRGGARRGLVRVHDQARPASEGFRVPASWSRRTARSLRRAALCPARDLLPRPVPQTALVRTISLIGSTGSIGTQAIDVIRNEPGRYRVVALGASTSIDQLAAQATELRPEQVAIADESLASELAER